MLILHSKQKQMMKSLIVALGLSAVLFSSQSCAQKTQTVAFYNVENLFDTLDTPDVRDEEFTPEGSKEWNSERYTEKLNHVNTVFELLEKPIIFGLCEIENRAVIEDVRAYGKMKKHYSIVHTESLDKRGIDNAILYNRKKLKLNSSGIVRFEMPEPSGPSRDIIWAKFLYKKDTILAMVNHWPSRWGGQAKSEPKRLIAATAARNFLDSVMTISPSVKIVFMGDLNDYPDNLAPQMISEVLKPMITPKSGEFGGTNSYKGEWNILDHIMVSNNFLEKSGVHVREESGKIYSPKFLLGEYKGNIVPARTYGGKTYLGGYSDHLPVSIGIGM